MPVCEQGEVQILIAIREVMDLEVWSRSSMFFRLVRIVGMTTMVRLSGGNPARLIAETRKESRRDQHSG